MPSPLSQAIDRSRGLIMQGWNPGAIKQYLAASPYGEKTGAQNITAGQPIANPAGGVQSFKRPNDIQPGVWNFLNNPQNTALANRGGVGGPVGNPGGLENSLPTYLQPNQKAPKPAGGVQRFK